MSTKHTPGPWRVGLDEQSDCQTIRSNATNETIARLSRYTKSPMSDAKRIVACVNACEGINPEAVPEMLAALKEAVAANERFYQNDEEDDTRPGWLMDMLAALKKAGAV